MALSASQAIDTADEYSNFLSPGASVDAPMSNTVGRVGPVFDSKIVHAIYIGPAFRWDTSGSTFVVPKPDSGEVARCERLLCRLIELSAENLQIASSAFQVSFGVSSTSCNSYRFSVFSRMTDARTPTLVERKGLERVTEMFQRGISGTSQADLITDETTDDAVQLADKHVREYVATDERTRFDSATELVCGDLRLLAPPKVIEAPPREVVVEILEVTGFVDALGRSSREIGVRDASGTQAKAKFDVGAYLDVLCDLLRLRGSCLFRIEQTTHEDGSVSKKLIDVRPLQRDWIQEGNP